MKKKEAEKEKHYRLFYSPVLKKTGYSISYKQAKKRPC